VEAKDAGWSGFSAVTRVESEIEVTKFLEAQEKKLDQYNLGINRLTLLT
jgi:hypothetical protein